MFLAQQKRKLHMSETLEQATKRLCKRHMARTLSKIKDEQISLTPFQERTIVKGFSFLMNDLLDFISETERERNDKNPHNTI